MYDEVERLERKEAFSADSYYFERNFINPPQEIINVRKVIFPELKIEFKGKQKLANIRKYTQSLDLILMNLYECVQRNLFLRYGRAHYFFQKVRINNINKKNVNRETINTLFTKLDRLGYIKQHIGFQLSKDFGKITRVKILDRLKLLLLFKLNKPFESSFINDNIIRMRDENKNYMNYKNMMLTGPYYQTRDEFNRYESNLQKINSQYDNTEITVSIPISKITDHIIQKLEKMIIFFVERNHIMLTNIDISNTKQSIISIIKNICSMVNYIKINNQDTDNPGVSYNLYPGKTKKNEVSDCNYYKKYKNLRYIDFKLVNNYLCRIFKHNLKTGGRFYGAVHQILPSEIREFIKIDGQETVELDYQAFHYRMMYNCKGYDYKDDPFKMKSGNKTLRKHFKQVGVIMLNCDGLKTTIGASINYFNEKGHATNGKGILKLIQAIENRCKEIKELFYKNMWGSLQYGDSVLMETILLDLKKLNIIALPIHDSVIVQKRHKNTLHKIMTERYRQTFGFDPIIDCK